jgi:hypothetical protein
MATRGRHEFAEAAAAQRIGQGAAQPNLKPFKKGSSGNPSGRPREYGECCTPHFEAIETLVLVMRNGTPGEAMMAAQTLLDRAWGRPKVTVDARGASAGGPRINDRTEHRDPRTPWLARRVQAEEQGDPMGNERSKGRMIGAEWEPYQRTSAARRGKDKVAPITVIVAKRAVTDARKNRRVPVTEMPSGNR